MDHPWANKDRDDTTIGDRETIFMATQAYDSRQDMYKTVWACPACGELHICLAEPPLCHGCDFKRPGFSDMDEYEKVRKEMHKRAGQRIAKKVVGNSKSKGGKKRGRRKTKK